MNIALSVVIPKKRQIIFVGYWKNFPKYTPKELRTIIYERYNNAIKALGLETDPFEAVTGVSMYDAYVRRHEIMPSTFGQVFLPDTGFIDSAMFPTVIARSESYDVNQPVYDIRHFDNGYMKFRCGFKPVVLCKPQETLLPWTSRYIAADWHPAKARFSATKGYIILESEALSIMKQSKHYLEILAILARFSNGFSHDTTSHGTLSPLEENVMELVILQFLNPDEVSEFESFMFRNIYERIIPCKNYLKSIEIGALSLHLQMWACAIRECPALLREIIFYYHRLRRLLSDIKQDHSHVKDYFMRFFTYLLTRILPDQKLRSIALEEDLEFLAQHNPSDTWMIVQAKSSGYPLPGQKDIGLDWLDVPRVSHKDVYQKSIIINPKIVFQNLQ